MRRASKVSGWRAENDDLGVKEAFRVLAQTHAFPFLRNAIEHAIATAMDEWPKTR